MKKPPQDTNSFKMIQTKNIKRNTGLICILFFLLFQSACKNKPVKPEEEKLISSVKYAIAMEDLISIPVNASGVLASKTQSNLSFLTGGIIRSIHVSEGDIVGKNDLLAQLDLTEINSRVYQADLAFKKAQRDFTRIKNLYSDSVATLEQYQDIKTSLDFAESTLRIANFNKKYSEIRAPEKGKILKLLNEVNEIAAPGYPVLVFASTEADWVLKVNVPDRDIVGLHYGDSALIQFDAFPGMEFSGIIMEMANSSNVLNGSYGVEIKLIDLPEKLVTGLIGNVQLFPVPEKALIIPAEALRDANGLNAVVFKLSGNKVKRLEIKIKEIFPSGIVVKEGLQPGDTLITAGNQWLQDGAEVLVGD